MLELPQNQDETYQRTLRKRRLLLIKMQIKTIQKYVRSMNEAIKHKDTELQGKLHDLVLHQAHPPKPNTEKR